MIIISRIIIESRRDQLASLSRFSREIALILIDLQCWWIVHVAVIQGFEPPADPRPTHDPRARSSITPIIMKRSPPRGSFSMIVKQPKVTSSLLIMMNVSFVRESVNIRWIYTFFFFFQYFQDINRHSFGAYLLKMNDVIISSIFQRSWLTIDYALMNFDSRN